jgi:hypothetical protein
MARISVTILRVRIGPKDCSLRLQDCSAKTECIAKLQFEVTHASAYGDDGFKSVADGRLEVQEPNDSSWLIILHAKKFFAQWS